MNSFYPVINVKLDEGAFLPERAHDTDAGADLRCREAFTVEAGKFVVIDTGVHIQLPPQTKAEIKSKSGLNTNHGILTTSMDDYDIYTTGLIDEGFSGTIKVAVYNFSEEDYHFERGEKVTQICVSPVCYPKYVEVDEVKGGDRGNSGYGSTGRL